MSEANQHPNHKEEQYTNFILMIVAAVAGLSFLVLPALWWL